jgi:K+:H+ antiporter
LLAGTKYQFLVTVATLAMLAIPLLEIVGRRAATAMERWRAGEKSGLDALAEHIIVGGFGRVSRTVGRVLDAERISFVALDLDADLVAGQKRAGMPVFCGDASRREVLERVGAAQARAFVVTTDEPYATERMVKAILTVWPAASIHARALDAEHAKRLSEIGVKDVVPEALEGSLILAGRILAEVGMPDDAVDARLNVAREAEIRRLGARRG